MKSCRDVSENKKFSFSENRSTLILLNKDEVETVVVKVDGCEIDDENVIRCDYMLLAKQMEIYIELKGHDIVKAIRQIENTIEILSKDKKVVAKKSYIICTRSPLASTQIQHYDRKFREKYNSKLIVKTTKHTDHY